MGFIFFYKESPEVDGKTRVFECLAPVLCLAADVDFIEIKTKKPTNPLRESPVFVQNIHTYRNLVAGAGFEPTTFGL